MININLKYIDCSVLYNTNFPARTPVVGNPEFDVVIPNSMAAATSKEKKAEFTNPVYDYMSDYEEEENDSSKFSLQHSLSSWLHCLFVLQFYARLACMNVCS